MALAFLHVDVKYLPQMPDERPANTSLLPQTSRWVPMARTKSAACAAAFPRGGDQAFPGRPQVLTDNGRSSPTLLPLRRTRPHRRHPRSSASMDASPDPSTFRSAAELAQALPTSTAITTCSPKKAIGYKSPSQALAEQLHPLTGRYGPKHC